MGMGIRYFEDGVKYEVHAVDDFFHLATNLFRRDTANVQDFEENFLPKANQVLRSNVIQVLGADSITLCPFGALLTLNPNSATDCDVEIPYTSVLRGGLLFVPTATLGDWITVSLIDKNNITGQGGTPEEPTILGTYVTNWFVMPGMENKLEDISITQQLPPGLFLRVTYNSVAPSGNPFKGIINFIAYAGTP